MKLMASPSLRQQGFALPTILLLSVIMLSILVASIGSAAASRVTLDAQYYRLLARHAAESGIDRAKECLEVNGYTPQWGTSANNLDLEPQTNCDGTGSAFSAYVVNTSKLRTSFSVENGVGSTFGSRLNVTGTTELLRTSTNATGGNDVWRSYTYTTYLTIEPPQEVLCPSGFISVPGNSLFGTSDFCVAKYEAKSVGGLAVSEAAGTPIASISQTEAIREASDACDGCGLITEAEWLTIAHNVIKVASNWSGGAVGSGYIYSGHNDNNPANSIAASTNDSDGYNSTGNTSGNQRRTLTLSNGEVIWDFAGNLWEWTAGQTTGGQPGASTNTAFQYTEWPSVNVTGSLAVNPFPSNTGLSGASSWNSTQGIGQLYSYTADATLRGFRRGGSWSNGSQAGVFSLVINSAPSTINSGNGFRIAK